MRLLPGMGQIPDYMYYRKLKQWTAGRVAPPGIMFEFRDIVGPVMLEFREIAGPGHV